MAKRARLVPKDIPELLTAGFVVYKLPILP